MKDTFINIKKHAPIKGHNKHQSTVIQGTGMDHSLQICHKQLNLFNAPVKTPLTYIGKNQMNTTHMPNHLRIKLNKGLRKDNINANGNGNANGNVTAYRNNQTKYLNEVQLPKLHHHLISIYHSQSKSPFRKRDFTSSLRKKVNQSQGLGLGLGQRETQTEITQLETTPNVNVNQTEALVRTQTLTQTQNQSQGIGLGHSSHAQTQTKTQGLIRTKTQPNSQTTTHTRLQFNININNNNNNNNNNVANETSATTSAEEKHGKINKMNILFEFEKSTLIIQKIFKGWLLRKRFPKLKEDFKQKAKTNKTTSTTVNCINNIDTLNKESKSRLKLLDVNENDVSLSHSLSNVSRLSINTQDLNYDSGDNDDLVNIDDDDVSY